MGLLDFLKHHAPSHQEVMGALHTVEGLSQDTVAGAAAFEAAKIFENHVAQHGHEKAKDLATSAGHNLVDRALSNKDTAKRMAKDKAKGLFDEALSKHVKK